MSEPNTWAKATVKNDWGSTISSVELHHRYDHDHFDDKAWRSIDPGASGDAFDVGYWTGILRTGYDYWLIRFEADGRRWSCKGNFYCFLRSEDAGGTVVCRVYKDGDAGKMEVMCPQSSNATVSLSSRPANPATRCDVTIVPTPPFYLVGEVRQPAIHDGPGSSYPMEQASDGDRLFSVEAAGELTVDERQEDPAAVTQNVVRSLQCTLKFKISPKGYMLGNRFELSFPSLDAGVAFGLQSNAPVATGFSGPLSLQPTASFGMSITLVEISTKQQIGFIPPGAKLGISLDVSIDALDPKVLTFGPKVGVEWQVGKFTMFSAVGQQQQLRLGQPEQTSTILIGPSIGLRFDGPKP